MLPLQSILLYLQEEFFGGGMAAQDHQESLPAIRILYENDLLAEAAYKRRTLGNGFYCAYVSINSR